jgi:hypothetical protein
MAGRRPCHRPHQHEAIGDRGLTGEQFGEAEAGVGCHRRRGVGVMRCHGRPTSPRRKGLLAGWGDDQGDGLRDDDLGHVDRLDLRRHAVRRAW